jgi:hypothetical protein
MRTPRTLQPAAGRRFGRDVGEVQRKAAGARGEGVDVVIERRVDVVGVEHLQFAGGLDAFLDQVADLGGEGVANRAGMATRRTPGGVVRHQGRRWSRRARAASTIGPRVAAFRPPCGGPRRGRGGRP